MFQKFAQVFWSCCFIFPLFSLFLFCKANFYQIPNLIILEVKLTPPINQEKKMSNANFFFSVSSEPNFQLPQFWIFPSWKFKSKFNRVSWNYFASHIFNWASSLCGIITHRCIRTLKMLKQQHMTFSKIPIFIKPNNTKPNKNASPMLVITDVERLNLSPLFLNHNNCQIRRTKLWWINISSIKMTLIYDHFLVRFLFWGSTVFSNNSVRFWFRKQRRSSSYLDIWD